MSIPAAERVEKRHTALRMDVLRPVQICVPNACLPGLAAECKRQSSLARRSGLLDVGLNNKVMTINQDKLGEAFVSASASVSVSDELMLKFSRSMAVFLGIAR